MERNKDEDFYDEFFTFLMGEFYKKKGKEPIKATERKWFEGCEAIIIENRNSQLKKRIGPNVPMRQLCSYIGVDFRNVNKTSATIIKILKGLVVVTIDRRIKYISFDTYRYKKLKGDNK